MSISLCIPYMESDSTKQESLERLLSTVTGYDELILIWNDGLGFAKPVNMEYRLAKGDFIVHASDDIYFAEKTDLRNLVDESGVTCPHMQGREYQKFWGNCWTTPRWVYEKIGMFPKEYEKGLYYEDDEYYMNLTANNIPVILKKDIIFVHPEGGRTAHTIPHLEMKRIHNQNVFYQRWGVVRADLTI